MADFFDNQVPAEWREAAWDVIRATPALTWQILTKRPQNIAKMLPADWGDGWANVWLGVTVENREECRRRIPVLQAIPARIRFLSCEPLLEQIEPDLAGIHQVICGGESGQSARMMEPDWARALRDQCRAAGVAYFHKQMTKLAPIPADLQVQEFPA